MRVVSDPDRKLALLVVDQSLWSKQLRIHSQHVNLTQNRVHPLLLNYLHRNPVDPPAVANKDFETLADSEWLRANEVDGRENILQLARELGDRMTRFSGGI